VSHDANKCVRRVFRSRTDGKAIDTARGIACLLGLGLPQLLHADRTPRRHTAKACILLFMWGGPAHQDTWELKPNAPAEYRGEFKPIATKVLGIEIYEYLPRLAKLADRLAIVRSMTHGDVVHTTATHPLLTGHDLPRRGATRADQLRLTYAQRAFQNLLRSLRRHFDRSKQAEGCNLRRSDTRPTLRRLLVSSRCARRFHRRFIHRRIRRRLPCHDACFELIGLSANGNSALHH
jgi:hypothetical protein